MKLSHALIAGLVLLLLGILAGTFYQTGNVKREKAVADSLRVVRIEDQQRADELDAQRLEVIRLTHDQLREAEETAARAERRLASQERETAALNVTVIETNVGCPPEHIEADSLLALSNAREKASLREMLDAMEAQRDAMEMRYIATDAALDARTLECQTCREEAEAWERAANPGWFTRFRRSIPQTLLTAGGVLLLVVAL